MIELSIYSGSEHRRFFYSMSKKNISYETSKIWFVVFLILFLFSNVYLQRVARTEGVARFFGMGIPYASFSGVLSSVCNLCLIGLVVLYKKLGFITSLFLVLVQIPILMVNLFVRHVPTSIPGLFADFFIIVTLVIIYRRNSIISKYQNSEVKHLRDQQKVSRRLFEQTATALVTAIDAKDTYSHGHSIRVAEYSERIAKELGMNEEEVREVYYAGLLHDVGKLGVPNHIINKKGKLTDEEYDIIKLHPVMGNQILSSISEYPYLSIGAHFHHERYDGKGYPNRLKGDDIPKIARIISVADAYDAMSSKRSYRDIIPQQIIREEIVKGAGTQFDPTIAKIMQHLIDVDTEYQMREKHAMSELAGKSGLHCTEHRSEISDGINITPNMTGIHMEVRDAEGMPKGRGPSIVLFDSLDGRVYDDEKTIKDLNYFEYCEIWFDGHVSKAGARKVQVSASIYGDSKKKEEGRKECSAYDIDAVKYKDHVLVKIDDGVKKVEVIIALPDSSRFVYIGLTGENCDIEDVSISRADEEIKEGFITRIADEISYIDVPAGDVPNVQIDGYRTDCSKGIPVDKNIRLDFHTMSLPTSRLVWHCPYFVLYSSDDGTVNGENYKEYGFIRLDGEDWQSKGISRNILLVNKLPEFIGWDAWKEYNKKGYDCRAVIERNEDTITLSTDNFGIVIVNRMTILDGEKKIYVAITGDQVALTNIKIS